MPAFLKGKPKDGAEGRRALLRSGAALAVGGVLALNGIWEASLRKPKAREPVSFLPGCTACTGCAAACPTQAIAPGPGRMMLDAKLCIRCGYCVAACPVGGVALNRE